MIKLPNMVVPMASQFELIHRQICALRLNMNYDNGSIEGNANTPNKQPNMKKKARFYFFRLESVPFRTSICLYS